MKHTLQGLLLINLQNNKKDDHEQAFWSNVRKYTASKNKDESFVSEVAYMMVTLHRTGA